MTAVGGPGASVAPPATTKEYTMLTVEAVRRLEAMLARQERIRALRAELAEARRIGKARRHAERLRRIRNQQQGESHE